MSTWPEVLAALAPGVQLLLDDGKLRLVVEAGSVQDTIARRDTEAREAAQRDYGVVLKQDYSVDRAATSALRRRTIMGQAAE